jgi:serine/threonine-protein kinase
VEGETLAERLAGDIMIPTRDTVKNAAEVAMALITMDEADVLHRDIKPENILLESFSDGEDVVKVMDFGIAWLKNMTKGEEWEESESEEKTVYDKEGKLTKFDEVAGTPIYMSIERARGLRSDIRSDLYSVGIMMFKMLTGEKAFATNNFQELWDAKLDVNARTFSDVPPVQPVPKWLQQMVEKLYAHDPKDRYQSAEEFYDDLKERAIKEYPDLVYSMAFLFRTKEIDLVRSTEHTSGSVAKTQPEIPTAKEKAAHMSGPLTKTQPEIPTAKEKAAQEEAA